MHQDLLAGMPLASTLGIQLDTATPSEVRGHLDWAPHLCTLGGILHGGTLMALADTLGALCAYLNLPDGANTATIESKTNFFRAVREGTLHSLSQPLHVGRTTIAVQTDLADGQQRLAARITQTQAILPARA